MATRVDRIEDYPGCGVVRQKGRYIQTDEWDAEIVQHTINVGRCGNAGRYKPSGNLAWSVLCDDCWRKYGLSW